MSKYKLNGMYKIKGKIKLETGLHIGGDEGVIEIGGNDNPIVRDITTGNPYIPGSSLKGKMRYLMEWYTGSINEEGSVYSGNDLSKNGTEEGKQLLELFGSSNGKSSVMGPTRITVKDSFLTIESVKKVNKMKESSGTDTELKTENNINRLNSSAKPRNLERVPRDLIFDMEINYKILNIDDKEKVEDMILKSLKLVEIEGIGGAVSRGSGQVKFIDLKIENLFDNSEENMNLDEIKLGE